MTRDYERLLGAIEDDVKTLRQYAASEPVKLMQGLLANLALLYQDELLRAPLERVPTVQAGARQALALRDALRPDGDTLPRI